MASEAEDFISSFFSTTGAGREIELGAGAATSGAGLVVTEGVGVEREIDLGAAEGAGAEGEIDLEERLTDLVPPVVFTPRELRVIGFLVVKVGVLLTGACCCIPMFPIAKDGVKEGTEATSFLAQEGVNSPALATQC